MERNPLSNIMTMRFARAAARCAAIFFLTGAAATSQERAGETTNDWALNRLKPVPAPLQLERFQVERIGGEVGCLIYLPPEYTASADTRYPVVYWLHGSGGKPESAEPRVRLLDSAIRAGEAPPMIIVAPNGLHQSLYVDSADGTAPMESVIVKDLIPHIDATYRTVAERKGRAIEGFSMGGYGALHLAFKYPELFSSVTAFSPALIDPALTAAKPARAYATALSEVFGGDEAQFQAENPFHLLQMNLESIRGQMKIRLFNGDADQRWIPDRLKDLRHALDSAKVEFSYKEISGAGHNAGQLYGGLAESEATFYQRVIGGLFNVTQAKEAGPQNAP